MWKKYGRARQATDDNLIWRMRFACWITSAADTQHTQNMLFQSNNGFANTPTGYVIRNLLVLLDVKPFGGLIIIWSDNLQLIQYPHVSVTTS